MKSRFKVDVGFLAAIALAVAVLNRQWQSVVFISLMLVSARIFLYYTDNRARRAIQKLLKLRPQKVHLKINEKIIETETEKVKLDDLVLIETGERVPIDGIVESGEGAIDQSSLTGESEPINKEIGNSVFSSTLVVAGSLLVRAKKVGEDTTFAKIIDLVEKSQSAKAPISSITDKFATWYVVLTLVGALAVYFFSHNLLLVLSILLVTCADDLAVAIPLSFTAAINAAARKGIIVKGGTFIEGFPKIKAFIFDKTATLTTGKPKIETIMTFNDYPREEFLSFLGTISSESQHPTAKAIAKFIKEKNIKLKSVSDLYEKPGYGSRGVIDKEVVFSGKDKFLEESGIKFSQEEKDILEKEKNQGHSITVLGIKEKAIGFISMIDSVRPHAAEVVNNLKKHGVERVIMLTGDNKEVAARIAQEVHITEYRADLLPEDKVNFLKEIIKPGYKVAMVGDGVNDAPSLVLADIGIAMGAIGTDAAIESADVVLMKDKLVNVLEMMKLSRQTMKIINQDFWIWGLSNVLGLALVFGGALGPSGAAAFNFLTDFLPLFNSLRLFRR
ncbi:MAG: cation-translocating P-type ATPase [Candidatus Parcubacteria bacterium]|nr:cation-translocating P-type ATPase [Candidatus Parcubacteria bacterium]